MLTTLPQRGKITDPPSDDPPSASASFRYAHPPAQRPKSPLGRQDESQSTVFCDTCLTNQHFRYEMLRELDPVSKDEDPTRWREQQNHIADLERRYPQVCSKCRPKAREAIKRANYLTRSWNMMLSMRKTQSGDFKPVVKGRAWRSALLRFGHIGREVSIVGQALWHLLGARIVVSGADTVPTSGDVAGTDSAWAIGTTCASQTILDDNVNPYCFAAISHRMLGFLSLSFLTIWWNNMLWAKYLDRKPGKMVGSRDYYILQVISLTIRGIAWASLRSQQSFTSSSLVEQFPDKDKVYRGLHLVMIALISFTELLSRRQIRLENKFRVTPQRDEDILPETPAQAQQSKSVGRLNGSVGAPDWATRKSTTEFPISSMSSSRHQPNGVPRKRAFEPPPSQSITPALPKFDDTQEEESMDWVPTPNTSFTGSSYNLRSRDSYPDSFSSERQRSRQLPNSLSTSARNPKHVQQSSFFSTKSQKSKYAWDVASETSTDMDSDRDDERRGSIEPKWNPTRNPKQNDFAMAPTKLWLNQDKVDTGLENMFDEVFTLAEPGKRGDAKNKVTSSRGHEGLFGNDYVDTGNVQGQGVLRSGMGWLMMIALPVAAVGVISIIVLGTKSSL